MELDRAIELALDGEALLFVGAGFCSGAKNLSGESMKSAEALTKSLADELGIPSITGLDDAAEEYADLFGEDQLIELLHNEFTASDVAPHHLNIADVPWKRVYTTNYDNVLEVAYSRLHRRLNPATPSDNIRRAPRDGTMCVHLNGFIDRLTTDSLWNEFRLTSSSYASGSLLDSPWISAFRQDLRIARAVFFIGYSLADLDIKRVLFESQELRDKTFFVLRSGTEKSSGRRAARYGSIVHKDVAQLAELFSQRQAEHFPKLLPIGTGSTLQRFTVPTEVSEMNDAALFDLLLLGEYREDIGWDSFHGGVRYVAPRRAAGRILNLLGRNAVVVVHSELGNGKTLLLEQVKMLAAGKSIEVYTVKRDSDETLSELETLARTATPNTLIVIDDYPRLIEVCAFLGTRWGHGLSLLLSSRSSAHDALVNRLASAFGDPPIEVPVDRLSEEDGEAIIKIFDEYGIWGDLARRSDEGKNKFIHEHCRSQFSSILLELLGSPQILRRFEAIFDELRSRKGFHKVVISILVLTLRQFPTTVDTLVDIWGEQVLSSRFRQDDIVRQLCDLREGQVLFRSSVAAKFILQRVVDSAVVSDVLVTMARSANQHASTSAFHRDLLHQLMRFSTLNSIFPEQNLENLTVKYYENVKILHNIRKNPLFWLQYGIAMLAFRDFDRSEQYFKTAYSFAEQLEGFNTYQIDNHYARLLLSRTIEDPSGVNPMTSFTKARDILLEQMNNRDRLHYPYRVASLIGPFCYKFGASLKPKERITVARVAKEVLRRISLIPSDRMHPEVVACKENMEFVLEFLESVSSSEN